MAAHCVPHHRAPGTLLLLLLVLRSPRRGISGGQLPLALPRLWPDLLRREGPVAVVCRGPW